MADIDRCDLLFFPGGLAATEVINDAAFMTEAERLASGARYLTSGLHRLADPRRAPVC